MGKQVVEKGGKNRLLCLRCTKITILFQPNCIEIVPPLYLLSETRKGNPKPCPKGEIKVADDVSDYP
jgi:hypothetical protein